MSEFPVYDIANYLAKEQSIHIEKKPIKEKLDLPTEGSLPPELNTIAENIANISGTWNPVEIYTPDADSLAGEKKRVFEALDRGEEYNPQFKYSYAQKLDLSEQQKRLLEQLHKVRQFEPSAKEGKHSHPKKWLKKLLFFRNNPGEDKSIRTARLMKTALYFKIKDDLATCKLVEGIKAKDEMKIAEALKQKYPGVDKSLLDLAQSQYANLAKNGEPSPTEGNGLLTSQEKNFLNNEQFDATGIKSAFEWALAKYGILYGPGNTHGFKVKIDEKTTSIDVRDKSAEGPTVFIPQQRKMNGTTLLELIAHEIEGHARQSVNGEKLFKLGGGKLKIDNEQLYEGLGLRYETFIDKKLFGIENAAPGPFYTLAVAKAEKGGSFFDIFKEQFSMRLRVALKKPEGEMLPDTSTLEQKVVDKAKENAWKTTYRVMRGHIDMKNPHKFAMAKDLGYLRGYQMDKQLLENGLGFLNEEGIIASGALAMLAEFKLSPEKMPIPFKDVATQFWEEKLKPVMIKEQIAKAA